MSKVEYWTDLANYDLETAKAMNKSERFLYVGFMCHQVMEKVLKALNKKKCEELINRTEGVFKWVMKKL